MYKIVYIYLMSYSLADIFSSRASCAVLQVLADNPRPTPLREIAYRARLQPRSVQCAVANLLEQGLLRKNSGAYRAFVSLNPDNCEYEFLIKLFADRAKFEIAARASSYDAKAVQVLKTNASLLRLAKRARASYQK